MEPAELFDNWVEGAVRRQNQVDELGVHLTAAEILDPHSKGKLDFGGSEFQASSTHPLEFFERARGEPHGWWRLEEGSYIVRFNETLKEGAPPTILITSQRLLECGCTIAPAVCSAGPLRSVLHVPACGVNVKQNARIALLRPLA